MSEGPPCAEPGGDADPEARAPLPFAEGARRKLFPGGKLSLLTLARWLFFLAVPIAFGVVAALQFSQGKPNEGFLPAVVAVFGLGRLVGLIADIRTDDA